MTDLKLWMGPGAMPLIPFSYFVAPEELPFKGSKQFLCFMDLPPEIRRMIFEHCDTPTLFHLMHTSSYTRYECLELFWEPERDIWYRLWDGEKLWEENEVITVYPCPEFASRITQVEINIDGLISNRMVLSDQEMWDRVQKLFPSVRIVVFSGVDPKRSFPRSYGASNKRYSPIIGLVAMAPPNITVLVAFDYPGREGAMRHTLWRIDGCWSIVQDPWAPTRVLIPTKKFPPSLLNNFLTMGRVRKTAYCELDAWVWLTLDTYACHSDSSEIGCPAPGCNAKFPTLNNLKNHVAGHKEFKRRLGRKKMQYHPKTPDEVKATLDTKRCRFEGSISVAASLKDTLLAEYRRNGEFSKQEFKETLGWEMKEYGMVAADCLLDEWMAWHGLFLSFDDSDDYPNSDWDSYEEEDFQHVYAEQAYIEYVGQDDIST